MTTTPPLQNPFLHKHDGDVTIWHDPFELDGIISGDVFVRTGAQFICRGTVTGNVDIDVYSSAIIHGTINGSVTGSGNVETFGVVKNKLK